MENVLSFNCLDHEPSGPIKAGLRTVWQFPFTVRSFDSTHRAFGKMRERHGCTLAGTQQAEDTGHIMAAGTSAPFYPFLGTKERCIPPTRAGVREVLPTASPRSRWGQASARRNGGRPRRPSARLFVLQAGRRPPSHPPPPSGPPPSA